jgi:hypothetical protein
MSNSLDYELQGLTNVQKSLTDLGWNNTDCNFVMTDKNNPNNQLDNLLKQQVFNRSPDLIAMQQKMHDLENRQIGNMMITCISSGLRGKPLYAHLTNAFGQDIVSRHWNFIANFENSMNFIAKTEEKEPKKNDLQIEIKENDVEVPVEIKQIKAAVSPELSEPMLNEIFLAANDICSSDFDMNSMITRESSAMNVEVNSFNTPVNHESELLAAASVIQDLYLQTASPELSNFVISSENALSGIDSDLTSVMGGVPPRDILVDVYPSVNPDPENEEYFKDQHEDLQVDLLPQTQAEGISVTFDDELDVTF